MRAFACPTDLDRKTTSKLPGSACCGDFQLSLVVNNTHDFVIFLLASSLRKICSQDGRASNSEQAGRHLLHSTMVW